MPRSSVILGAARVDAVAVARAAGAVRARQADPEGLDLELRAVDEGAALQVLTAGTVVLTVLRARALPSRDEVARLLPGVAAPGDTGFWSDAYTPWRYEGAIGIAILDALAEASGAVVTHQGLAPAPRRAPS